MMNWAAGPRAGPLAGAMRAGGGDARQCERAGARQCARINHSGERVMKHAQQGRRERAGADLVAVIAILFKAGIPDTFNDDVDEFGRKHLKKYGIMLLMWLANLKCSIHNMLIKNQIKKR
jgi:hypothetical protein